MKICSSNVVQFKKINFIRNNSIWIFTYGSEYLVELVLNCNQYNYEKH